MDEKALVAVQITLWITDIDEIILGLRKEQSQQGFYMKDGGGVTTFSALTHAEMVLRALR